MHTCARDGERPLLRLPSGKKLTLVGQHSPRHWSPLSFACRPSLLCLRGPRLLLLLLLLLLLRDNHHFFLGFAAAVAALFFLWFLAVSKRAGMLLTARLEGRAVCNTRGLAGFVLSPSGVYGLGIENFFCGAATSR